jgi:hypothetical protein
MISENGKVLHTDGLAEEPVTVPLAAHQFIRAMVQNNFNEGLILTTEVAIATCVLAQAKQNLDQWYGGHSHQLPEPAKADIRAIAEGFAKIVQTMGLTNDKRLALANECYFALTLDLDSASRT